MPLREAPRSRRQAKTPLPQPDNIPLQMPIDPVNVLLEALRALLMEQQDLISNCQLQLVAFVKVGLPTFDGFQGPIAAN